MYEMLIPVHDTPHSLPCGQHECSSLSIACATRRSLATPAAAYVNCCKLAGGTWDGSISASGVSAAVRLGMLSECSSKECISWGYNLCTGRRRQLTFIPFPATHIAAARHSLSSPVKSCSTLPRFPHASRMVVTMHDHDITYRQVRCPGISLPQTMHFP